MGGGGSPATQSTAQALPKEVAPFYKDLMSRSSRASRRPFQKYTGKRLTPYGPDELRSQRGIRQLYQQGERPELGIASRALGEAGQYARNVPMWGSDAYAQYSSPFFEDVLDVEKRRLASDWDKELTRTRLGGVGAGAYGGSGQMEQLALGTQNKMQALNEAEVMGRQRAWEQAQAGFQADRSALQSGAQMQQWIAQQSESLAKTQQAQAFERLNALEAMGAGRRELEQKAMDIAYNDFLEQESYERKMLSWYGSMLHGVPLTADTMQVGQPAGPSTGAQIAGGIASGLGAIGSAAGSYYGAKAKV